MKKLIPPLIALLLMLELSFDANAQGGLAVPDIHINSEIVYLYNLDEDVLVYERAADQTAYPASLTKIMTTIVAMENTPNLNSLVTLSVAVQNYLFDYQVRYGVGVSLAGISAGEQLPMIDLLHSIMLQSGNEAAMAIAEHVAGSQEAFVEMMNTRAHELGAVNTNFTNATGLPDPAMVTTARDMAILTRHAMGLPGFMDIANTTSYTAGPTNLGRTLEWGTTIHMQLPGSPFFYPYLSGVKTGTTPQAGRNLISTASRDGFNYLLVVMRAPFINPETGLQHDQHFSFIDTRNIYEWAFDTFSLVPIVERNLRIHEIPLRLSSSQDFLPLEAAESVRAMLARGTDPQTSVTRVYELPESVDAPISRGESVGYMLLYVEGRQVGRVELLAAQSVSISRHLMVLEQARQVINSFWFRFGIIFVCLLAVSYIILTIQRNKTRRYRPRRRL